DENTVIIFDGSVAALFKEDFNSLYDSLPAELACVEEVIVTTDTQKVYLPLVVNPSDPNSEPVPTPVPTVTPIPTQTPTPVPQADIELIKIIYDPDGSDVEGEFVEIFNSGTAVGDMTGWVLEDEAGIQYVFPTFTLNPSTKVTVWVGTGVDDAANLYWNRGSAVWNNNGDAAFLLDSEDGNVIDSCAYEGGDVGILCQD
ncbi:MAG: lamin tail domain-containing protein, partial [Chloroflexota bacterium]